MAGKYKKVILSVLYTALILLIWRLAYHIQIPLLDRSLITHGESMFGFLDVFSGGALSNYSIVALGSPLHHGFHCRESLADGHRTRI